MRNLFITTILNTLGISFVNNGLFVQEDMSLILLNKLLNTTAVYHDDFDRGLRLITKAKNIYMTHNYELYINRWNVEKSRYEFIGTKEL